MVVLIFKHCSFARSVTRDVRAGEAIEQTFSFSRATHHRIERVQCLTSIPILHSSLSSFHSLNPYFCLIPSNTPASSGGRRDYDGDQFLWRRQAWRATGWCGEQFWQWIRS